MENNIGENNEASTGQVTIYERIEENCLVDTEANPPNPNRKRESLFGKFGCKLHVIF